MSNLFPKTASSIIHAAGSVFAKFVLATLLALSTSSCALVFSAAMPERAYAQDYTYTVRVFAGNQGTFDGESCVELSGFKLGERFSFNQGAIDVTNNSKYYVKGLKLAGRDNDTATAISNVSSFTVDEDVDLVVAYGLKGSVAYYDVNYVDTDGNTLVSPQRFEGNVGDRPVVAYRYIEGFQPQAYNLTGTLSEKESDNQFTFVYTPVSALSDTTGEIIEIGEIGTTGATTTTATPGAAAAADAVSADAGAGAANVTAIDDDGVPLASPEEIVDINDDEVPLASGLDEPSDEAMFANGSPVIIAVVCIACVLVVLLAWYLLIHRRRKRNEVINR